MDVKKQNIQILRIVACFFVLLVHVGRNFQFEGTLRRVADIGAYAPYLFFVISGYVTVCAYSFRENFSARKYYFGRFVRIMPLYYLVIVWYFIYHAIMLEDVPIDKTGLGWARYIFCVNRLIPEDNIFWTNLGSTWSISSFLCFYMLFPLVRKRVKNVHSAVCVWIICNALRIIEIPGVNLESIKTLHYFAFGMLVYYVIEEGMEKLMIFLSACCVILLGVISGEPTLIYGLIFGILITSSANFSIQNGWGSRVINFIDEYTYAVYLVHPVVLEWVPVFRRYCDKEVAVFSLTIASVAIFCIVFHELYEKPICRLAYKLVRK